MFLDEPQDDATMPAADDAAVAPEEKEMNSDGTSEGSEAAAGGEEKAA